MASAADHYAQAKRNETFFEDLGGADASYRDWAMTTLFYAATHYIQAACTHQGIEPLPDDHGSRFKAVKVHFRTVAPAFEWLYQRSCDSRYECIVPSKNDLRDALKLVRQIATEVAKVADPVSYV